MWAVYASGYPSPHKVVLWKVGHQQDPDAHTPGEVQYPTVAAGPGGRLWVSWIEGDQSAPSAPTPRSPSGAWFAPLDHARRSRRVTDQDRRRRPARPARLGHQRLPGPVKGGSDASQIYSARIYEGLAVGVSPRGVSYKKGGTVR